nr:putative ribonuclease H-like domain-containing protein [Tanacetum cinerariifolium]
MDVKSAFLYGTINEEVYVMQPPGFQDPEFPHRVYKVEKDMYGLHQAPRAWYGTLSKYLLDNGFQRGTIDQTLFIKKHKGEFLLVQVYVDNIIFGSSNPKMCRDIEALMHDKFQMSVMGELNFFLGLQVLQKKDGIFLSQDKYVGDILKKFGYIDIRVAKTPMDRENPWEKDGTDKDVELHLYLKGHPKLGLWYLKESPFDLVAYSDSDYGGANQDRKSTTGGSQFLGRRLISWQCKKQTIIATSTTKAEYVAAASGRGQVLWIQNQLLDYGYNFMSTMIYIYNNSVICIDKNPVYHSKTKHIEIRHHFIRDFYEKKLINVDHIHTDDSVADLLPKSFDVGRFQYLVKTEHNTDFHQIVDFLEASHIRYALMVRPTVYVSHIRQFWSTTRVETTDEETKILAKVNGRKRTVFESSTRRHLKLNDEEDQDEPIHHEQITQSPQHAQITSHEPITQHEQTTSQEPSIPSQSHSVITTPRRITKGTIRISQSKVPSPGADETAFPIGDVRYGEAFPTITRLDARQELMDIYTSLQRQQSLMEERVQSQDLEIIQLKTRVKNLEGNEKRREGFAQEDAPNTRGWIKGRIYEMANVLGTLGAANILVSGGLRSVFTTASLSVATASTVVSPDVATASRSFPTAVTFTTASVATPTTRVTRSSRGVVIESSSLISVNIPSISKKDKGKRKMIEPDQPKQAERDSEIARIYVERELEMMIAELDMSNGMVAKYLSEYEQAEAGLSHDEKVELIDELLMYQRHLAQIKKYQAQQNKPATKTERRNFNMSILRSNAAEASGIEPTQEQQSEEPKELSEEELKKMIELVPVEELYIKALQVKYPIIDWEIYSEGQRNTTEVTDEKVKELWVELKRLYEPDSRDPLWAFQRYMHDPLVWRLYDTCGVHHVSTIRGHKIFMLVEKDYPLTKGFTTLMLCNKLQVDQYSEMANELVMKIYIIANSPR